MQSNVKTYMFLNSHVKLTKFNLVTIKRLKNLNLRNL